MTYASEVLADSPRIYWRLGDASGTTATDSSGNGKNGTYSGSPTLGATSLLPSESSNTAVSFDGVDDYVAVSDTSSLTAFTVEAWIKLSSTPDAGGVVAVSKMLGSPSTSRLFNLRVASSLALAAQVYDSGGSVTSLSGGILSVGTAYHVALTFSSGGDCKLYLNGSLNASGTRSGSLSTASIPFTVGARSDLVTFFPGVIDEVAFYGTDLSAARILAHYTAGTTLTSVVEPSFLSSAATLYSPTLANGGVDVFPNTITSGAQVFAPSVSASIKVTPNLVAGGSTFYAPSFTLESQVGAPDPAGAADGWNWGGIGIGSWTPAVTSPVAAIYPQNIVAAQAYDNPVVAGTQVLVEPIYKTAPAYRDRILIAGRDVTYFRGVPTPIPDWQLIQPLLWGAASIQLPQVAVPFEQPGYGALSWLKPGASVMIQRVNDETGAVVATDYRGLVIGFDISGGSLTVECGGHASGRAALVDRQMRLVQQRQDAGLLCSRAIRSIGNLRHHPPLGTHTGIELIDWGGGGLLDYINELVAKMTTVDGDQWTIMPDSVGTYHTMLKDLDTIHGTVYPDDARIKADLRRDISEEPNRVFASGVTPEGMAVKFGAYPGLIQGPAAPYPMDDHSSFGIGTTDADTDTGDGITVMGARLFVAGLLDGRADYNSYDAEVAEAIKDLQRLAGLTVSGTMTYATWRALWNQSVTGYDLRNIRILPAAARSVVTPYRLSSNGSIIARNPLYDPTIPWVDRTIAMGAGFTKRQMRTWARNQINNTPVWRGTIELNLGAIVAGNHTPGDPITSILRDRNIKPGMNLSLPTFAGGIVVHVAGVSFTNGGKTATLAVSTEPGDTLPVWAAIQRDRESRETVHRSFFAQRRAASFERENTFDEVGGTITPIKLNGGNWTVFPVVAKQAGTIEKIHMQLSPAREFVMAVFGRKISPGRLRRVTNAPLTKAGRKRWTEENVYDKLNRDHVVLYVAGSDEDPCGYFPKRKSEEEDAPPLTGRWEDDASFPFVTFQNETNRGSVLWVAVWVGDDATLRGGRIMWPSAEDY